MQVLQFVVAKSHRRPHYHVGSHFRYPFSLRIKNHVLEFEVNDHPGLRKVRAGRPEGSNGDCVLVVEINFMVDPATKSDLDNHSEYLPVLNHCTQLPHEKNVKASPFSAVLSKSYSHC